MSHDQLLAVAERCHAAALDGARWPAALAAVADVTGGVDTTLEVRRGVGQVPIFFANGDRLPDHGVRNYLAHYSKVCPRIPYLDALPPGEVGFDHAFITEAEMDRDEFYADFLAPDRLRYFIGGSLRQPSEPANHVVAVHRSPAQGPASAAEIERMRRLLPHIGQAVDTFLRLRRHSDDERLLLDTLNGLACGVVLLDRRGRVVHVNAAAAAIVRAGDGLDLGGGRLRPSGPDARRALDRLLAAMLGGTLEAATVPGGSLYVPRRSGRPPYGLRLRRLPAAEDFGLPRPHPAIVLFIDDLADKVPPDAARIAAAFGLTRRQAELAAALYAGQSLRQHAATRGIGLSTARFHLYQLLARLGLRRQQELIRLIGTLSLD